MPRITDQDAADLIDAVLKAASTAGLHVAVAVVDETGQLLAFRRDQGTFPAASELAMAKAKTAAMFRRTTQAMQQNLEQGRLSYLTLPGTLPLAGGVPLVRQGAVVGALGISGASSSDDAELAESAAQALDWAGQLT